MVLDDMEKHTGDPPYSAQQIWQRLEEYYDLEELVCPGPFEAVLLPLLVRAIAAIWSTGFPISTFATTSIVMPTTCATGRVATVADS